MKKKGVTPYGRDEPTGPQLPAYVRVLREWLQKTGEVTQDHLLQAYLKQKESYNQGAQQREFQVGQKFLVLLLSILLSIASKFLTNWQGPFEIIRQVGPVNYEMFQPEYKKEKQIFHINLLKLWRVREGLLSTPIQQRINTNTKEGHDVTKEACLGVQLIEEERVQLSQLVREFRDVFSEVPRCTKGIKH